MRTYLSGLTASGYAHPQIIPGAIYLDKNGNRVTVKELMFDRVYFIRDGYSFLSSLNVEIFIREGANKRGNSSRLTQSFHFFMFEPI
ncbi:DUF4222 domain-containing protein, partial [Escherichia coli]|nr:DUF4222 domain-containing protein [Escherichia coli]MDA6321733.1 DUF4222 domain-containing protein [Escherichia coli]